MAISSPLRTAKVKSQSVPLSNNSIKNIQETLIKQKKVKKEILDRKNKLQDQRRENERRQQLEDQLEAPNLVITPSGPIQMIQNSTKGFLERILGFLGYLTAGWLMNNLATWIAMGKEFIGRVQRLGQIITGLLDNTTNIFIGFGNLLSAAFQNLIQFDLFDTSNRVNSAFENLNGSISDMGKELEEAIQLITSPLSEGITTGENAPPTGSKITDEGAYEPGEPYSGVEGQETSGGRVSPQAVYSYIRSKGVSHTHTMGILANIEGESGFQIGAQEKGDSKQGVGLFQYTFPSRKQAFLRSVPNYKTNWKGQIDFAIGKDENTPLYLRKQFSSPEEAADDFMRNWENPDKRVYAERRRKHNAFIKNFKPGGKEKSAQVSQQSTPTQIVQVPPGKINPIVGNRLGAGRNHGGTDLAVENGTPLRAISDGVIVDSDYEKGWGNFLVMKDDRGIYHLYGHMQSGYKRGGPVKKGEVIGKVGMTGRTSGPHLHWEAGTGWNGGVITGKFDPLNKYSKFAPFNTPYSDKSSPSQPEPQIGSVNSQGKIYVDSKYGYQSRATVIAKGLLPSQDIKPQTSTPQQNLVNPPGALAPGQRPDRALTSEQLKIAQQTREQGKAFGLTGEALEKSVAAAVMASSSTTQQTPAQISQSSTQAQQNQQLSQQITPDRRGQTIIFQQPSQSQSLSYSTGGGSGMMPISVNEIALVNNFMKKKLLLDLAYL
jgi:murein DD-endopeptidase MepM/ murein hydrolase activator NlpD